MEDVFRIGTDGGLEIDVFRMVAAADRRSEVSMVVDGCQEQMTRGLL